jgi:hypothetical protein
MKGKRINTTVLGLTLALGIMAADHCVADETMLSPILTKISSTTLSGYVDTTATWRFGTGDSVMPGNPSCPMPVDFTTPADLTVVPEPSTMALVSIGAAAVLVRAKRVRR